MHNFVFVAVQIKKVTIFLLVAVANDEANLEGLER